MLASKLLKAMSLVLIAAAPVAMAGTSIDYDITGYATAGTGEFAGVSAGDVIDINVAIDFANNTSTNFSVTSESIGDLGGLCCGVQMPFLITPIITVDGIVTDVGLAPYHYINQSLSSYDVGSSSMYSLFSNVIDTNNNSFELSLQLNNPNDGEAFNAAGALPVFTSGDTGSGIIYSNNSSLTYTFNALPSTIRSALGLGTPVPEPVTAGLLGLGLLAAGIRRRKAIPA